MLVVCITLDQELPEYLTRVHPSWDVLPFLISFFGTPPFCTRKTPLQFDLRPHRPRISRTSPQISLYSTLCAPKAPRSVLLKCERNGSLLQGTSKDSFFTVSVSTRYRVSSSLFTLGDRPSRSSQTDHPLPGTVGLPVRRLSRVGSDRWRDEKREGPTDSETPYTVWEGFPLRWTSTVKDLGLTRVLVDKNREGSVTNCSFRVDGH